MRRNGSTAFPTYRLPLAGVAQLVEHQPSKLRVAGSSPVARFVARVAQLVERILGKDEVRGSIPRASLFEGRKWKGRTGKSGRSLGPTRLLATRDSRLATLNQDQRTMAKAKFERTKPHVNVGT